MRIIDGLIAFPDFLLAIAIAGFFGPSLQNVIISIVAVKWIGYARVVRGIVLSEKKKKYVQAAIVSGTTFNRGRIKRSMGCEKLNVIISKCCLGNI